MCNCLQVVNSAVEVKPCAVTENSLHQVELTVFTSNTRRVYRCNTLRLKYNSKHKDNEKQQLLCMFNML